MNTCSRILIALLGTTYVLPTTTVDVDVRSSQQCVSRYQEPINLYEAKRQIKEYRQSGRWDQAITCAVDTAYRILHAYIPVGARKLAVVIDIDDTALSNWDFIAQRDFSYDKEGYRQWELLGKDPAIVQVRNVANFAYENGFGIFFITGRREDEHELTERNLRNVGFKGWNAVYYKPQNYQEYSNIPFKSGWRKHIQEQGYLLIVNIGDQMSDLLGHPTALHSIKVSNPMYYIP